eukprot:7614344-Alexandrium_andersonii.AAC.1
MCIRDRSLTWLLASGTLVDCRPSADLPLSGALHDLRQAWRLFRLRKWHASTTRNDVRLARA